MRIRVRFDGINQLFEDVYNTLAFASHDILQDLVQSGTMPYNTGYLQNEATYVDLSDKDKGICRIISDADYAEKVYYHPEAYFSKRVNENAGGHWFATYIDGEKKELLRDLIIQYLSGGGMTSGTEDSAEGDS